MTALINQLRDDLAQARKNRDAQKLKFLSTLLNEASREGFNDGKRDATDAEVTRTIKKFIDNTEDTLRLLEAATNPDAKVLDNRAQNTYELGLLQAYLPKQASEDEVRSAVESLVSGLTNGDPKQMGALMGQLTARFGANFDKALASKLVKAALAAK